VEVGVTFMPGFLGIAFQTPGMRGNHFQHKVGRQNSFWAFRPPPPPAVDEKNRAVETDSFILQLDRGGHRFSLKEKERCGRVFPLKDPLFL
jgi:hypothetical protein